MEKLYSLQNAKRFNWSSISGNLNPERVSHLEKYLIGEKVLDAGCGGGAYVEFLASKGLDVTGIDKYDEFLQVAREKGKLGNYVQGDMINLPFSNKSFDCTYCFDVLEHVDDRLALQELIRVTRKRLILAVPKEDEVMQKFNLTFLHYQDKTHLRNYTQNSLKNLVSENTDVSNLSIFPELAIPLKSLIIEMMVKPEDEKNIFVIARIYQAFLSYLFRSILNKTQYKQIHTGLIAVLDL